MFNRVNYSLGLDILTVNPNQETSAVWLFCITPKVVTRVTTFGVKWQNFVNKIQNKAILLAVFVSL